MSYPPNPLANTRTGHLSTSDLITFLKSAQKSLRQPTSTKGENKSLIFVKENVCDDPPRLGNRSQGDGDGVEYLDEEDSSLTRWVWRSLLMSLPVDEIVDCSWLLPCNECQRKGPGGYRSASSALTPLSLFHYELLCSLLLLHSSIAP